MSTPLPALLTAHDMALSYGYQELFQNVTLAVGPGEKVGLVGRNGCGKTSLLKVLIGEEEPDQGTIDCRRGLRIGYLPQEFNLNPDHTVRQNIESGASDLKEWIRQYENGEGSETELGILHDRIETADGWNLSSRIEAVASALSTAPLNSPVAALSGGEKRRVALCRALVARPDLLLLDEPTNHLDADSIGWLEDFLKSFPGAVILVTHDRYFLDVIVTRIVELDEGRCFSHPGNYTAYLEAKAVRQSIEEQTERRRQRFLREELDWVRAGVKAQRSKARHRLDTFYEVKGLEAPPEEREMDLLIPPAPPLGNRGVELTDVGARVGEGDQARWLFRGLTFNLNPGQCTGVVGRNGVGKTTLLQTCLGKRPPEEGRVRIGKMVVFNYIDQTRMQLQGNRSVLMEVADGNESIPFGERRLSTRAYLKRYLFSDQRVNESVDRLSGGERARLMLAKVLRHASNLLVLDEPTNDLDLPSLRMLEEALADFDGSVLVVSHDRYFLDRICDQIVAFEPEGVHVQPGNYSYYLEKRKERAARIIEATPQKIKSAPPGPKKNSSRPRRLSYKETRELASMEEVIMAAEERVSELEKILNDPDFYSTRAREAPQRVAELEAARVEVVRLYARWSELDGIGQ